MTRKTQGKIKTSTLKNKKIGKLGAYTAIFRGLLAASNEIS
jgi:hypothetical protein